ncbi:hypothetical protein C2G38_2202911 [Gigaspora rosea]|uniref:Uncharacterized protein n=1 Tax=Gigaspora rosea TaxID=44941 RepID=A0A397UQN1_9GLOM|nr:hypothetical protein C2G38_2202911 [Gigaspora rosea]
MVSRGMQACETSSLVAVGSGIIADMYELTECGSAYGNFYLIYTFSILLGSLGGYFTLMGSFIGGKYNNLVIKWEKNKLNDNESIQPEDLLELWNTNNFQYNINIFGRFK